MQRKVMIIFYEESVVFELVIIMIYVMLLEVKFNKEYFMQIYLSYCRRTDFNKQIFKKKKRLNE